MNHTDEILIEGSDVEASVILRQVLASLIAGVTTEVTQTDNSAEITVSVVPVSTGLKFYFRLPSATAVATVIQADMVMSDSSGNPVQNRVIKAYVDDKFWIGTEAEYAALEDKTEKICFLSDTNVIMYNEESYSLSAHAHGNLSNEGAIGALSGLVVMTGTGGVLEAVTVAALKDLIGSSSGLNLLHNAEFMDLFNTAGLTIYNTTGECVDRWDLNGAGTLTINTDYATLAQATANTAKLKQFLPAGSYERLMGQTLTLSVLLDNDQEVYAESGVINGADTTIIDLALPSGFKAQLVVDNSGKTAYVELAGGATAVADIDLVRVKLEIGGKSSIEEGVMDKALDWARTKLYALDGTVAPVVTDFVKFTGQTLTVPQQTQARTNIGAAAAQHASRHAAGAADAISAFYEVAVPASGWSASAPYTQTITVSGIVSNDKPLVDIVLSATTATAILELAAYAYLSKLETSADSVTLTCLQNKPTTNFNLLLRVVK